MRNIKRLIALVIAVIMCFGFAVMAGAAYTDADMITYSDAVNTLTDIGITHGNPDASFRPNASITRAELAAMIYRFIFGGMGITGSAASSNFVDVDPDEWYAVYVEYCEANGIISGDGLGYFDPQGFVTGHAAIKMILCALGAFSSY